MTYSDAAQRWADVWQRSWQTLDAESIVALYAQDATYSSEPYRIPFRGQEGAREYIEGAFAEETDVRAWFGQPVVTGSRAAVQWWASLVEDGKGVTLAGTSILTFDGDGLVVDQWDTWNSIDERREPPEGWGR
ncbi:MAG: nuclear transport factor 2 family protein [Chloroflexota bacterium]|nr:nuclear transport factor 2 family protein [Chloroflexota bacterium]